MADVETQPPPGTGFRSNAPALLLGATLAGFGLSALGLSLSAPAADSDTPTLPALAPSVAVAPLDMPEAEPLVWPALFGTTPTPEPEPETVSAPVPPESPPLAPLDARLRGLALDDEGGWALIEMDDGVVLVRPGSVLTPDHQVEAILSDGVKITTREGEQTLTFEESTAEGTVASRIQPSLQRAIMTGRHDFDQLPMPLPPEGYRAGPGFSGPANR